jgi:hypothetical protein
MAIERVDTTVCDTGETGWSWISVEGREEKLLVDEGTLDLYNDNSGILITIAAGEVDYWIKALTKAKEYFVVKGIL